MSNGLTIVGDSEEYQASESDLEAMKEVGFEPPTEEKPEEPKVEKPEEPKVEKPEEPKVEKPEVKPEEVVDDNSKEEVNEDRTPKFVDLDKHKKMRDRAQAAEKEVEELRLKIETLANKNVEEVKTETTVANIDEDLQSIADEMGVTIESVKKLYSIAESGATQKLESKFSERFKNLEQVAGSVKAKEAELLQEQIWDKQFKELKDKFPNEDVESKKKELKELAFSKQFSKTPLDVIYKGVDGLREVRKKTVESGSGGSTKGEGDAIDFSEIINLPENEMNKRVEAMDAGTFEKFTNYIEKNKL
jgi:hypothetical protein